MQKIYERICKICKTNIQEICKKYAQYAQSANKYAQYAKNSIVCQKICKNHAKKYAQYAKNMQKICKKYAQFAKCTKNTQRAKPICSLVTALSICKICQNMQDICKKYVKYAVYANFGTNKP